MIFRSTYIYYNQHHDISHLMHLHNEVLMEVTMARMMMIIRMIHMIMKMVIMIAMMMMIIIIQLPISVSVVLLLQYQLRGQSSSSASDTLRHH